MRLQPCCEAFARGYLVQWDFMRPLTWKLHSCRPSGAPLPGPSTGPHFPFCLALNMANLRSYRAHWVCYAYINRQQYCIYTHAVNRQSTTCFMWRVFSWFVEDSLYQSSCCHNNTAFTPTPHSGWLIWVDNVSKDVFFIMENTTWIISVRNSLWWTVYTGFHSGSVTTGHTAISTQDIQNESMTGGGFLVFVILLFLLLALHSKHGTIVCCCLCSLLKPWN